MKFLRQQFNKLCEDLGVDPNVYSDDLDDKLSRLILQCANYEYSLDEKQLINFAESKTDYAEAFTNAVEFHAGIMLGRLSEIVTGVQPDRAIKPLLGFSAPKKPNPKEAKESWNSFVSFVWTALEEVVSLEGPAVTLEELSQELEGYSFQVELESDLIKNILEGIFDNNKLLKELGNAQKRLVSNAEQLLVEPVAEEMQAIKYNAIAAEIVNSVEKYKKDATLADIVLADLVKYGRELLGQKTKVPSAETIKKILKQIVTDMKDVQKLRKKYLKWEKTRDAQLEAIEDNEAIQYQELPMTIVHALLVHPLISDCGEDDLYTDLVKKIEKFFDTHPEIFAPDIVVKAKEHLQDIKVFIDAQDNLEGLCQVMRLLNISSVGDLLALGKEECSSRLQDVFFHTEMKRTLKIKSAFNADDFKLDGDREKFMQNLVPIAVYCSLGSVADMNVHFSEFAQCLGHENEKVLKNMQLQFAKILEWDFFVHHAEYRRFLADYMHAQGVPENIREIWQTEVMPELITKIQSSELDDDILREDSIEYSIGKKDTLQPPATSVTTNSRGPTPLNFASQKSSPRSYEPRSNESSLLSSPYGSESLLESEHDEHDVTAPVSPRPIPQEQAKSRVFTLSISNWLSKIRQFNLSNKFRTKAKSNASKGGSTKQKRPRTPSI